MPVKAGDRAPSLTFTKIVQAGSALGGPQSLFGQTTVLYFLRPVSINEQAVTRWNELVEQFADRPVNFVWIATEEEETLEPFLKAHPIRGWLALDPEEDSYKAYGIEGAGGVLIDPHGIIIGFTSMNPEANQIQAVLDGRAIAIKGDPTEAQMDAFFKGNLVRVNAEPDRVPPPPQKPDLPPPSEEVHIAPSETHGNTGSSGPDHWMQRGFDLKTIVAMVSETDPSRVELPDSFDAHARYDFVLVPPKEEPPETMFRQVREGIEKYFHVVIVREIRPRDAYVMTAIEGRPPPPKQGDGDLGVAIATSSGTWTEVALDPNVQPTEEILKKLAAIKDELARQPPPVPITSISARNASLDDFRLALERPLDRPIVDETKLTGRYDLAVKGEAKTTEEFFNMLRDQLGLLLTPSQRSIETVVVRPAQ
jgi:uncharacterized protein (TIGR03435 family)